MALRAFKLARQHANDDPQRDKQPCCKHSEQDSPLDTNADTCMVRRRFLAEPAGSELAHDALYFRFRRPVSSARQ